MADAPTVVIVEDDEQDCQLLQEAFEERELPWTLIFFQDGDQLMDYLRPHNRDLNPDTLPDAILLDITLPKHDGLEILRQLKSEDCLKSIPIIMLSGSISEEDATKSLQLGAVKFIVKPTKFDGLLSLVDDLRGRLG